MDTKESRIAHAERLNGGVVVTFDDGRSVLYSAALLLSCLSEAKELFDESEEIQ